MRLYIIRHADPDYVNHTITPRGHREAAALAAHFVPTAGFTHLYSSPLPRAVHTAEYVAKATGLPISIEPWTAEIHDWHLKEHPPEYEMAWDIPGEELHAASPPYTSADWHSRPPFTDEIYASHWKHIRQNSDALFARHGYRREGHRYRVESANTHRVALVCHGGFGLTWLSHLLNIPTPQMWSSFWLTPTGVSVVLFDERNPHPPHPNTPNAPRYATPRVLHHNLNSHLTTAQLPFNPHGIKANFE